MGPFARTDTARALEALLAARAGNSRPAAGAAAGAAPAGSRWCRRCVRLCVRLERAGHGFNVVRGRPARPWNGVAEAAGEIAHRRCRFLGRRFLFHAVDRRLVVARKRIVVLGLRDAFVVIVVIFDGQGDGLGLRLGSPRRRLRRRRLRLSESRRRPLPPRWRRRGRGRGSGRGVWWISSPVAIGQGPRPRHHSRR